MEKYINHDLEQIQEERENAVNYSKKAKILSYIDISTMKNKNVSSRTSYKDNHAFKTSNNHLTT